MPYLWKGEEKKGLGRERGVGIGLEESRASEKKVGESREIGK